MGTAISIKCCVGSQETEDVEEEKESSTVKFCPMAWHSRHLPPPPPPVTKVPRSISNATTLPS